MSQGCQPLLTWAISRPALLELDTPLIENTTTTISLPGTTTTSTTLVAMTADAISTLFPYQSHYWTALAIDTTVDDAFFGKINLLIWVTLKSQQTIEFHLHLYPSH